MPRQCSGPHVGLLGRNKDIGGVGMPDAKLKKFLMELLEHYTLPGEAKEAFPGWWEQLDDAVLWKVQNEVRSLQDRLSKLESEIAATRLNKEKELACQR